MRQQSKIERSGETARVILLILALFFGLVFYQGKRVSAQEGFQPGVGGFVDEDGDGFNDLLPDTDGDGIPDALDPDSKGHKADSTYMHMQRQEQNQYMWQHMNQDSDNMMHGEPGMFGPGDSTSHGGMHDGGHMGGGGMGGGMEGGGGMGPGGGSPPNEGGGSDQNSDNMGGGNMGGSNSDGGSNQGGNDQGGGGMGGGGQDGGNDDGGMGPGGG